MYLIRLVRASLRSKKGSFISIIILTFVIALSFSTIISLNSNIEKRSNEATEQIQMGDLLIITEWNSVSEERVNKARKISEVAKVEENSIILSHLQVGTKKGEDTTCFTAYHPEQYNYNIFSDTLLSFEKTPQSLEKGEVYLPVSMYYSYSCNVGDTVSLQNGDNKENFTVKGFFEEPYMGAQTIGLKLALMNEADFNRLYKEINPELKDKNNISKGIMLGVFKTNECKLSNSEFKKLINSQSAIVDYGIVSLSKDQCQSFTLMFNNILSGIMYAFLALLSVVVLIVMGHSITGSIDMEYTNLGVLKALGVTKLSLRLVFIMEYIMAEVIGCILGISLSKIAIYYLNQVFVIATGLLSKSVIDWGGVLALLVVLLMFSAVFIFWKTKKIAKISPMRAIQGGKEEVYFHSRMEASVSGKLLNLRIAFRQITSNKKQYISGIIIISLLVFFLVSITALNTSMDSELIERSFGGVFTDVNVKYDKVDKNQLEKTMEEVEQKVEKIVPIKQAFCVRSSYFTLNGEEYHGSSSSNLNVIKSVIKGRLPKYENEVLITKIVADEMELAIGDTVTIGYKEKTADYVISGFYQDTTDLGKCFVFSTEARKRIDPDMVYDSEEFTLQDKTKSKDVVKMLNEEYQDMLTVTDYNADNNNTGETLISTVHILNNTIYVVAVVFALVVVILLCGKAFYREQTDIGIYKAVGFTSKALRLQFAFRFLFIAMIGSVVGIILNIGLNNMLMGALFKNLGVANYETVYTLASFLLPTITICICFFVFAYLVAGKIKRVDTKSLITE
ncbi:MAG: FtsX-like permease family protein [bacterium]|nr:FtsX-like permease family protein [bacterium]